MAKLSIEQLAFLVQHDIPLSRVFDASGMVAKSWQGGMAALDMWVAFGGAKCQKAGHQLRSRNSDCLQCRPAAIGYIKRYYKEGDVYVAQSASKNLFKVGSAQDSAARLSQLCGYAYGGAADWKLKDFFPCKTAGRAELEAHRILSPHQTYGTYFKNGEDTECRELFKCSYDFVLSAVKSAVKTHG